MRYAKCLGSLSLLLMHAQSVMASEASHGINWWHLGAEYKDSPALGWLSITFVIFVYGVCRAVKKPLSLYLETRSKDIRRQIEEGRQAKIESEKKLKLYDEKLRSLGQEIEKMKQGFAEIAQAEKVERARMAKEMEARIARDTEDTIRANIERAKNRLAEEAIVRAMVIASKTISDEKRDEVDSFLKDNFLLDLSQTALEMKREYVVNQFVKSSAKQEFGASAREVQ